MTNHSTMRKVSGLAEHELERVRGGYLSVELENVLISSFKDDRKPQVDSFSWGQTQEGTF